jgi:hypothetical protein
VHLVGTHFLLLLVSSGFILFHFCFIFVSFLFRFCFVFVSFLFDQVTARPPVPGIDTDPFPSPMKTDTFRLEFITPSWVEVDAVQVRPSLDVP